MNIFLVFILGSLLFFYALGVFVDALNVRAIRKTIPQEFAGFLSKERYARSQSYLKENTAFGIITNTFDTFVLIVFILIGGFNFLDKFARNFGFNEIITGLIFIFSLSLLSKIVSLPFSIYQTFVIEHRYGFNKTTPKTFVLDLIKGLILQLIIGGVVFAIVLFLFQSFHSVAWILAWITVALVQLFLVFIAPIVIMPIFNKFTPLEEGKLRQEIEKFAQSQNFKLGGIFTIDSSKRSTKSNAFFTGIGKYKRIALYDTLIKNHTTQELVSILAHEIGHYKLGHIKKLIAISILSIGVTFYLFSLLINNQILFAAFKMEHLSIYASLVFASVLYSPFGTISGFVVNSISRKFEYEADQFAVKEYKKPKTFIESLKKLSADNLSNLTPHKLYVILNYSHPTVLQRIRRIRQTY